MRRFLKLVPAKKTEADCRLVMDWRNDPETLLMFYHSKPKEWVPFLREYKKDYFKNAGLLPRFALYGGKKIAFLRFSNYKEIQGLQNTVDVDINLRPASRGRGLGARVLKEAKKWIFSEGHKAAVAEIKVENKASIRAFKKAGFRFLDRRVIRVIDIHKNFKIVRLISYADVKK